MTIYDIIGHKNNSAMEFYSRLRATTIQEAAKEPLRLSDLTSKGEISAPKQTLPTGLVVSYGGALCFYCLQSLISRYTRSTKPDKYDIAYMAGEMMQKYRHWTILDLPTFVSMCISARLPSQRASEVEYELVNLDIPAIMGKLESYDRMKPNPQALQGGSPAKAVEKELTDWQKTHMLDGTPYEWEDMDECKRYWKESPGKDDPELQAIQESIDAQTKGGICKSVNNVLGSTEGVSLK